MTRRLLAAFTATIVISAVIPVAARAQSIYPLIFPVIGEVHVADNFGTPRGGGRIHEGVDIMTRIDGVAAKGHPVVAAASGVVDWIGSTCCYLAIEHDDGWSTWYIHLNNDTPGTDDGQGWGIAPGITRGTRVEAGQLIGWAGDSGNAESTAPHLHFELRQPDGMAIDAYDALVAAPRLTEPGGTPQDPPCPDGTICDTVAFQDSSGRFRLWSEIRSGAGGTSFFFGNPGDYAFSGDWDCDGQDTLGLYRRSDGYVYLRNSNTQGVADISFFFGNPGDLPLGGDFDGDGCDTVSIYRPSEQKIYIINRLGGNDGGLGAAEYEYLFGNPGDKPFTGDFDGDGTDTVGLHRETTGFLYFRNSNTTGVADFAFFYGNPGDILFAGDWDGDGVDTVAVHRQTTGTLYIRNSNTQGQADYSMYVGAFIGAVPIGR